MVQYSIPVTYLKGDRFIQPEGAENDYTNAPRPFYSFGYVKRGAACFTCDGKEYHLDRGDIIFVPKGAKYRSVWLGEEETEVFSCFFDLVPFGEPIANRVYPMQRVTECTGLQEVFEEISAPREGEWGRLATVGHFFELLTELFSCMSYGETLSVNELILRAVRHIECHSDTPLRVRELANICHVSTSYFYESFKREMGVSPIEYKNRIMIRRAERTLIDHPDAPIEEISEKLGFESSIYFRRLFKAKTGMSPREYRKNAGREI